MPCLPAIGRLAPGLALCGAVTAAALAVERAEQALSGRAWLEALVLAIVVGTLVRTAWKPPAAMLAGIQFAAKQVLEFAVALMGATISFSAIAAAGGPVLAGIVVTVIATIAGSFLLGRTCGLPAKMALLVACGNSICGNSAIAAVAPVIEADSEDVATAIAFTAVLGIAVVLALPLVAGAMNLTPAASGILAGLTVYAVPQVLAAAAPMGAAAVQVGTVVKLVRVLMLGPVVTVLSLWHGRSCGRSSSAPRRSRTALLPGFIVVFLALAGARYLHLWPAAAVAPARTASNVLTIVAMAGLGLGVDLGHVWAAGARVSLVVTLSLLLLGGFAVLVLHAVGMA